MPEMQHMPSVGFMRLSAILRPNGPIPVSRTTWWQGVRDGKFPRAVKLGPRTTAWRVEDIRDLIDNPERWLTDAANR